ncbi:MAG: hypothetical protein O6929_05680, partial [candidate division NC10 bacterium]|nr:hypothetical protein [candidate division NC10 bacterium]
TEPLLRLPLVGVGDRSPVGIPERYLPPSRPRGPWGVGGAPPPPAWGVLSEASAERRIPLRPDGTRVSSENAFGTSESAAPARNASEK